MDNLHAVILGTTPYYAHADVVGNIRGYSNSGTRYGNYRYDEFGRMAPSVPAFGVLERPHWKGALWMEPGADLYYMRNRWYEPATGRFLSEDPIGLAGGINPYVFAAADPIGGFDPLGLQCPRGHICLPPIIVPGQGGARRATPNDIAGALLQLQDRCTGIVRMNLMSGMLECYRDGLEPPYDPPTQPPPLQLAAQGQGCNPELSQPSVRNTMRIVWSRTSTPPRREWGAWIRQTASGNAYGHLIPTPGSSAGMTAVQIGHMPNGASGFVHGHPNAGPAGRGRIWRQAPGSGDLAFGDSLGIDIYVVSRDSLYYRAPGGPVEGCARYSRD
jgi:RHS repeat-associated protein